MRGLAWLSAQVQPSGTLAGEAESVATFVQARSEAAVALRLVAEVPGALSQLLASETEPATELVARRAIALLVDGRDASTLIGALALRQNLDGGLGANAAFESSVLDTSWAALALAQANQAAGTAAGRMRAYLNGNVMADGGLRGQGDSQRLYNNAIGLMALQTTGDGSSAAAIYSVGGWLKQRQETNGGWGSDLGMTAMVLIAIAPVTADSTVIGLARSHLAARQAADGSWGQDPYLTALVARALLARVQNDDGAPLFATLKGTVVDRSTNAPLAGVQVELGGPASKQAITDTQGRFSIGELAAGTYGLQFRLAGYAPGGGNVSLATGQSADLGLIQLSQAATTGLIRGLVLDAGTDQPLAGVSITLSGAASGNALTAADGSFEFSAVIPGDIGITASLGGYQSASGTATLAGGQTLLFHPKLYRVGDATPSTGRITGSVVSASTGAALSAVAVVANGVPIAQSGADGVFDATLAAGTYDVAYSRAGYDVARQAIVLAAGSSVDVGRVALLEQRTTTTIRGTVRDGGGAPIANAAVQVVGEMAATTGADGTYALDELSGTAFDLRVSATGFNSLSARLQLSRPADVVQDFVLTGQAIGDVALGSLTVAPASATANTDVAVTVQLANDSGEPASVVATLQVFDAAGNFAGKGAAYDAGGAPLSIISLAAGERRDVLLRWNTARFSPGSYSLRAQLVEPGTFTATNPNGSILAERAGDLAITGLTRFIGTATADPPVLRAGLAQSIALSATLQNDGNTTIAPQRYTLRVVDSQTNAVMATRTAMGEAMPISALQTLAFAAWTPDVGGDFRIEVAADELAQGLAIGRVYVGDAARATFTVDKLFVPAGNQTARGTIHVEGQDVTTGTISDPLVPLIKTAVAKAVAYTDREAAAWTSRNQCLGCHIQTHGLFGGETNRRYVTNFDAGQRNTLFNIITSRQRGDGSFYNPEHFGFRDSISRLSTWALSAWREVTETAPAQVRIANYLLGRQLGSGGWSPDYTSPATGEAAVDHAPFILESLIRLRENLPSLQTTGVRLPQVSPYLPGFTQSGSGMLFRDATGSLYFGIYNAGRVLKLNADGSIADQWNGLPATVWTGITAPDGHGLWVATSGGLRRLLPGGVVETVNTNASLNYVAYGPNGDLWGVSYAANTIYRIGTDGATQVWLQSPQLNGPTGIAFDADGSLLVLSQISRTIVRVKTDRTVSTEVPAPIISAPPIRILRHQGKWWVTTTESVLRFNDQWRVERQDAARIDDLVALDDGSLLAAGSQVGGLRRITLQAVDLADLGSRLDASIDRGTTWLTNVNLGGTSDNRQLAHHLLGLGEAARFYKGTGRADLLRTKMQSIGTLLKSRQRTDGGWGRYVGWGSDSYVTATIGYALDYLDPSPSDPYIRKAVTWLLSRQQADGSWTSENGIFGTRLGATNWVSIWLPVMLDRLGGIDTDLTVTFPADVAMSSPSIAPANITPSSDGGTTVKWTLIGVTNEGRTVDFDLALAGMRVGEVRPVAREAKLTFANSFTNQTQDAPIEVPAITGSAFLALSVGTDEPEYAANTPVRVSAQVVNSAANLASGTVRLEVFAPDGVRIADLGRLPFSGVTTGAAVYLQALWNTAEYAAAPGYRVRGTLFDANDALAGSAEAVFSIRAAATGSPNLRATIATDKTAYAPIDAVLVTDRIRNLTANLALDGLQAVTTVTDPLGRVVFLRSETLPQLLAATFRDLAYRVALAAAPPGRYTATLVVLDSNDVQLGVSTTEFNVQSTGNSGQGITGTLSASPKTVKVGATATFVYSAANGGNAAVTGLPLLVRVLDPARSLTLSETQASADLAVGGWFGGSANWSVNAPVGTNLIAALYARVNNAERLLAQDGFRVIAEPFKVNIGAERIEPGRVLVLMSCPQNADGSGNDRADCVADRASFVADYLTRLGLTNTVTSDVSAFAEELRSGAYNIYWISGGTDKLDHVLAGEVRQAVQRGEALVMDGIHDERNRPLDEVVGIRFIGKYNDADLPINVGSDRLPAATLGSRGRPLRIELTGGEIDAVYSAYPSRPAVVSREYGDGAAVLFTFDWVGTLMQMGAEWKPTAEAAFDWIAPIPSARIAEGALAALRFTVANVGDAGPVEASLLLPSDFIFVEAQPSAAVAAGNLKWNFSLDAGATQEITVWMRASGAAGSHDFTLRAVSASGSSPAFTGTAVLQVASLAELAGEALGVIGALAPTSANERQARDRARADVQDALTQTANGDHVAAIASLVDAEVELKRISTTDIETALVAVARVQQVIERRAGP